MSSDKGTKTLDDVAPGHKNLKISQALMLSIMEIQSAILAYDNSASQMRIAKERELSKIEALRALLDTLNDGRAAAYVRMQMENPRLEERLREEFRSYYNNRFGEAGPKEKSDAQG